LGELTYVSQHLFQLLLYSYCCFLLLFNQHNFQRSLHVRPGPPEGTSKEKLEGWLVQ